MSTEKIEVKEAGWYMDSPEVTLAGPYDSIQEAWQATLGLNNLPVKGARVFYHFGTARPVAPTVKVYMVWVPGSPLAEPKTATDPVGMTAPNPAGEVVSIFAKDAVAAAEIFVEAVFDPSDIEGWSQDVCVQCPDGNQTSVRVTVGRDLVYVGVCLNQEGKEAP